MIFEWTMWHSLTIAMADWQSLPSEKAQTSEVIEITSFLGGRIVGFAVIKKHSVNWIRVT